MVPREASLRSSGATAPLRLLSFRNHAGRTRLFLSGVLLRRMLPAAHSITAAESLASIDARLDIWCSPLAADGAGVGLTAAQALPPRTARWHPGAPAVVVHSPSSDAVVQMPPWQVREALHDFYASNYTSCLSHLENLRSVILAA